MPVNVAQLTTFRSGGRRTLGPVVLRGHDLSVSTAENYRSFAVEARGRSPRHEELSLAVAGDARLLEFLATLPTAKRQPIALTESHGPWIEWLP
jgi:hypothetical protein